MKTRTRRAIHRTKELALTILAGLGTILLIATPARAQATKIETCPYIIDSPGRYLIAADLTCPGSGIEITADDVDLDGAHHMLVGPTFATGIDVEGTQGNVTINNVVVRRFNVGILVQSARDVLIMNAISQQNVTDGIRLEDSENIVVGACIGSDNPNIGVVLENTVDSFVQAGGFSRNAIGILTEQGGGNTFFANDVTDNRDRGIWVLDDDNYFQANHVTGSGSMGILVAAGSSGNTFFANTSRNNGPPDMFDDNLPVCVNTWENNNFQTDNEGDGRKSGCIQ